MGIIWSHISEKSVQKIILLVNNKDSRDREKSTGQPPVKHWKSEYLFQSYRAGHSNFSTCKLCIPKIAGKFPLWKAASAFEANVWNLHQLKIRYLVLNLLSSNQIHCNQWGKKERNKKKDPPSFQHLPAQPGCVWNPLGPVHGHQQLSKHDQLIIQGYWLILGLLKNPRSNISGIDLVTKLLWKAHRFIYLKLSTLWKIWGWEGVNCLFHICVYRVLSLVLKSQINNILPRWFLIVLHVEINSCNMERQLQEENK